MQSLSLITDGIFPYVIGGMQKHSYYLAKYFAKQQIHVDLYHTNQSKLDIDALELFTNEEKKFIRSFVIPFPSAGKLPGHYIKASYKYSEAVFEIFRQQPSTDFIYAKGFASWKLLEEKQKGYKCAPVGVNFHGYEMFQKAPDFKHYLISRFLLQKPVLTNVNLADIVFSYGGKITDVIKSIGIPSSKIIEIPTAIEDDWLNRNPLSVSDPLRFVFVGRFERRKGIEELNKALVELAVNNKFEFHFIGPIPPDKQLKFPVVKYHGSITDALQMREALQGMDVLVCPSHSEGMPNVIMEAMASGLAVIATDVGAVKLMVRPQNGLLIKPSDVNEISSALKNMLAKSSDEILAMKRNSLQLVENEFLWKNVIRETVEKIGVKTFS